MFTSSGKQKQEGLRNKLEKRSENKYTTEANTQDSYSETGNGSKKDVRKKPSLPAVIFTQILGYWNIILVQFPLHMLPSHLCYFISQEHWNIPSAQYDTNFENVYSFPTQMLRKL